MEQEEKIKVRNNIIQSFPVVPYKQTDCSECCPICLDPYTQNSEIKVLPCKHNYHPACITQWLTRHIRCPLCKANVMDKMG